MRPYLTLHHPTRARYYYDAGLWRDDTFYSLLAAHAQIRPAAIACRDGRQALSWRELLHRVDILGADLFNKGMSGGDRVSLWLSNRIEALVMFLACSRQGMACNPSLHRSYTCDEIVELLNTLEASALLTEANWGADRAQHDFDACLKRVDSLKACYTPESLALISSSDLSEPNDSSEPIVDADAVVYLAFTSGTTGKPKCVMHSSNTLLANARDLARDWELSHEDKLLSLSPLSHHIAWVGVGQWLITGCEYITDDPPQDLSRLDWLIQSKATYVMGVPTHAIDILNEQQAKQSGSAPAQLGNVRVFYMAGSPIPPVVAQQFVDQGIKPQNIYGMSENSSHQYTHPDDDTDTIVTSCGRGGSAYEVKIFDSSNVDQPVEAGITGEIGGRGACLMLGYFDNQFATEKSFNCDGWFLSGDLGSMDANSNLRIEGRSKDLIIRGGHNIYPSRIEALAIRHSAIEKAAAFAVADERLGEKVCLAIIGNVSAQDTLNFLAQQGLSKYDMPEYFVALSELPLTASGKILKRELMSQVNDGTVVPQAVRFTASVV